MALPLLIGAIRGGISLSRSLVSNSVRRSASGAVADFLLDESLKRISGGSLRPSIKQEPIIKPPKITQPKTGDLNPKPTLPKTPELPGLDLPSISLPNFGYGLDLVSVIEAQNQILASLAVSVQLLSLSASTPKSSGSVDLKPLIEAISNGFTLLANNSPYLSTLKEQANTLKDVKELLNQLKTYLKTPLRISDMDNNALATIAPRDILLKFLATISRTYTDENNFELSDAEIDELRPQIPDISKIFSFPFPHEIDNEYSLKKEN